MKKIIIVLLLTISTLPSIFAQRTGYVDTQSIMEKIPEYTAAQDEIDRISEKWQRELESMYENIEEKYKEYQASQVLMPEDARQKEQEQIFQLEREAKEYREKKFGYNGELFSLQEEKVKPIQDEVFKSVESVARQKKYDFVFDKAGEVTWLYTNSIYDLTNDVLTELGIEVEAENTGGN